LVVKQILNNKGLGDGKVKFNSDLKKVKAGENNLSLEFSQVPTDSEKANGSCMIKGEFTLYTDEKAKDLFETNSCFRIFLRKSSLTHKLTKTCL
jgi:hypothetical protein